MRICALAVLRHNFIDNASYIRSTNYDSEAGFYNSLLGYKPTCSSSLYREMRNTLSLYSTYHKTKRREESEQDADRRKRSDARRRVYVRLNEVTTTDRRRRVVIGGVFENFRQVSVDNRESIGA